MMVGRRFPTSRVLLTVVGWLVVFIFFFPVLWMWLETAGELFHDLSRHGWNGWVLSFMAG